MVVKLGEEESVCDENKFFKIRLKSKKTNKSLDFNIKCKIKRVETEQERNAEELKIEPYTKGAILQNQNIKQYLEQLEAQNPELNMQYILTALAKQGMSIEEFAEKLFGSAVD